MCLYLVVYKNIILKLVNSNCKSHMQLHSLQIQMDEMVSLFSVCDVSLWLKNLM